MRASVRYWKAFVRNLHNSDNSDSKLIVIIGDGDSDD